MAILLLQTFQHKSKQTLGHQRTFEYIIHPSAQILLTKKVNEYGFDEDEWLYNLVKFIRNHDLGSMI